MTVLALVGGLLLALALVLREFQLGKERVARATTLAQMHASLESLGRSLRRAQEDLYVLRVLLHERGAIGDDDFGRARTRLIDGPRRQAEARSEIMRVVETTPLQVVVDEGESIH